MESYIRFISKEQIRSIRIWTSLTLWIDSGFSRFHSWNKWTKIKSGRPNTINSIWLTWTVPISLQMMMVISQKRFKNVTNSTVNTTIAVMMYIVNLRKSHSKHLKWNTAQIKDKINLLSMLKLKSLHQLKLKRVGLMFNLSRQNFKHQWKTLKKTKWSNYHSKLLLQGKFKLKMKMMMMPRNNINFLIIMRLGIQLVVKAIKWKIYNS